MSLLNLLTDDNIWQEYLSYKKDFITLPKKVITQYEDFINNKKYKETAIQIAEHFYTFSTPKKIIISKMGKRKKRIVYSFTETENYILKMINYLLYKYDYLFAPNLYSFRKNNGVKKAIYELMIKKNINNKYGYKVDISNYFNSIPVELLLPQLKKDLHDTALYELLYQILNNKFVNYNGDLIKEEKGIMAGTPTSSFLANYYLKDMDYYFYNNKSLYCRYADDIIVFDKSSENINNSRNYIIEYLSNSGLHINNEKEKFYNPNDKIEFLGFSYQNNKIDISENSIKKIKGKIRRSSRGLRRWMLKKNATVEVTIKAMNRKFNKKFYGKSENDLSWKYWFFPTINSIEGLNEIDQYMQDWERYIATGVHNKKNYEKVPYEFLKKCNYKSLVNEYYKSKKELLDKAKIDD